MPIRVTDPQDELRDRVRAIETMDKRPPMDPKESVERTEAAAALAVENERLIVDYVHDCVKTSLDATTEQRQVWDHCWRVYNEEEPAAYALKDAWQSRVVVPKPFSTVQFGASVIKKAFSPDFLSIEDEQAASAKEFWKSILDLQNNDQHGKFTTSFTDATIMALAVGLSMEVIPRWVPGKGLQYTLVEPWKILRDPDAPRRDSQGGLYWLHSEWLDWHVLKAGEARGKYYDVARAKAVDGSSGTPDDPFMTLEAVAERKRQIVTRSSFRTMHLVREFYGTLLDKHGEVLIENAQLTVCGGRVIERPKPVSYSWLRWPGISFAPFPSLLSHGGRGMLKGVTTVWEAMCSLQCLFEDALRYLVNPPKEVCVDNLVDPTDVEDWPGKKYLTRETLNGQQVVREANRRDVTGSILANQQYHDNLYQRGSFVNDAVQGLPGYRKDITRGEAAQQLDQSLSVFQVVGANLEDGAVHMLKAALDVIKTFASFEDYRQMMTSEVLEKLGVVASPSAKNGVANLPELSGRFHVSGISTLMKSAETMQQLVQVLLPLSERPRFAPYIQPYRLLRALETRANLVDERIVVDEETAEAIETAEKEAALKAQAAQEKAAAGGDLQNLLKLIGQLGLDKGGGGEARGEKPRPPARKGKR